MNKTLKMSNSVETHVEYAIYECLGCLGFLLPYSDRLESRVRGEGEVGRGESFKVPGHDAFEEGGNQGKD